MKLQVPFLQLPVLFDAPALASEVLAIDPAAWRGRTQQDDGNSALTLVTVDGDPDNDELSGQMRPTPWLQQCPYVMQVLESLGATWGRARLMRLSGQAEVKPHVDINYYWRERMRVHIPLVTTPSVRFQCGEGEINMAEGECWIFDTWRRHRVVNQGNDTRIHLVADTVGGERFWELLAAGRPPGQRGPDWNPRLIPPQERAEAPQLDFESFNAPVVMTPWELREHIVFLLAEVVPTPELGAIRQALLTFSRRWQALWSCHGENREGWPRYRKLIESTRQELVGRGINQVGLRNQLGLMQALSSYVLDMALADNDTRQDEARLDRHGASSGANASSPEVLPRPTSGGSDPVFDRPVFIISPPRSGSTLLFETLASADGVYTIGDESHQLIEGIPGLAPALRDYASNRLESGDATADVGDLLRNRLFAALRDRLQSAPNNSGPVRVLEKTPKNALRIPFLKAVFPDARFIYLHRDPRQVLGSMIDGWESGHFQMYPNLPGWTGLTWSFLLTPGWRESIGQPLPEVVASQWEAVTQVLLDDLDELDRADWIAVDHGRFLADPQAEVKRVCDWAGWKWGRVLDRELPLSRYTLSPPDPDKWRRHADGIAGPLSRMQYLVERATHMARY
ncbi:MAG: sulfotransferase [Lysobacter sp.]